MADGTAGVDDPGPTEPVPRLIVPSLIDFVQRLRRRSVWQALVIYGATSWGVLQVVDTLAGALGLPEAR